MANRLLKQVVGIDVAQKELVVSLGRMDENAVSVIYAGKAFLNNEKGFASMESWVNKQTFTAYPLRYVMEATGVYHEKAAYYLSNKKYDVSIVKPNRISGFFRTLELKTITDKSMSQAIAMFGLEKKLDNWVQPKRVYRSLRQLTREREQLIAERTVIKNQLHAEQAEAFPGEDTIRRMKDRIKIINVQLKEVMVEIRTAIKRDAELKKTIDTITTIPGIGLLTATIVLAETNGFELIQNKRQLTSYAGLDIKEKESGTSVKGKPRISKQGNKYLRKAMYLPALAAIKYSERYKAVFIRIVSRNSVKMKGVIAVGRKLLEMVYTIYKTGKPYQMDYLQKQAELSPLNS
ncbi:IS110 family transposase [Mucilaginibacter sp.]|uniref:IS110 family transposase n=1 Tax=Mucilaginibacter sp. TaxID=1882438 RepID=UPI00260969B8|nr:IS110 family transposase [Mucilaginibacter sp.]MDB5126015.1 Transposase family protein [Mucilaginibacter sp.]